MPFRGTHDHTLDAKNRLTVPARYRAAFASGLVMGITVDQSPCVGVWRPDDYDAYTQRALDGVPPLSNELSRLQRFIFGRSTDGELDAAGRIMLPSFLISHAGLDKDVVVVGAGDHLELWDRALWDDHQPALLSGVAEITARVGHPA